MQLVATYFYLFLEICLFRRGPQDVPASYVLLAVCGMLYMATGVLTLLTLASAPENALLHAITDFGTYGMITWLLLLLRSRSPRFLQTFTAMLGTGALISVVAWPITTWRTQDPSAGGLSTLILWGVVIWSIAVTAHIVQHALEIRRAQAIALAMLYVVASLVLNVTFMAQQGS